MTLIASCGIICGDCAAFKTTNEKDMDKLAELAVQWGGGKELNAEDMLCQGCISDTVYVNAGECVVRSCAQTHDVKVCSQCEEYTCDILEDLWERFGSDVPKMKENLEKVK